MRWTAGLGGDLDAAGWWVGPSWQAEDNKWSTESLFWEFTGHFGMATSWQGIILEPGEVKTINLIIGAGYRGYNQPLASPTPSISPTSGFNMSDAAVATGDVFNEATLDYVSREPFNGSIGVDDSIEPATQLGNTDGLKSAPLTESAEGNPTDGADVTGLPASDTVNTGVQRSKPVGGTTVEGSAKLRVTLGPAGSDVVNAKSQEIGPSKEAVTGEAPPSAIGGSKPADGTRGNVRSAIQFPATPEAAGTGGVANSLKEPATIHLNQATPSPTETAEESPAPSGTPSFQRSGPFVATPTHRPTASGTVSATAEPPPAALWQDWRFWTGFFGGLLALALVLACIIYLVCYRLRGSESSESPAAKGTETGFAVIDPTHSTQKGIELELAGSQAYTQENPIFEEGSESGSNLFFEPGVVVPEGCELGPAGGRMSQEELLAKEALLRRLQAGEAEGPALRKEKTEPVEELKAAPEPAAEEPQRGTHEENLDPHGVDRSPGAELADPHGGDTAPASQNAAPEQVPAPEIIESAGVADAVAAPLPAEIAPASKAGKRARARAPKPEVAPPAGDVSGPPQPAETVPAPKVVKPARVRPKLVIDGASASAIEAFHLGETCIRNRRGESLGVAASGSVSWGSSVQKFETFAVSGHTALRAINGKFVSTFADGTMRADSEDIGAEELYVPQVAGGTVTLRTKDGGFLGGEDAAVTMDEEVLSQIAEASVAPRLAHETFESEAEPEGVPARLLNIPAASSSAAIPTTKMTSTKPRPAEAPARKQAPGLDLGKLEARCGEPGVHRMMISIPNASDRANAKVHLEQAVEVAKIAGVCPAGNHLAVTVTSDYRVSGTYPVKVIVTFNGKTITGEANIVIKHNTPQPFGMSAIVGGQSDATIPYLGQLWQPASFVAHFEPALKEFHLTAAKGSMDAGAKYFPFRVVFMPKDAKPVTTLLVVVFDHAEEYTVEIVGSTAGFTGRTWKGRAKQAVPIDIE